MDELTIADYTVIRRLGAGGMGQVYLAQHPRLPRQDAVKVLDPSVSRNEEFRRRFERESEILAPISHPNIVTLYDRGDSDGRLWLAMEYIAGQDAGALLRERGRLDPESTVRIVAGAAAALDFMVERHGVTHRDVKPGNILVTTRDGRIDAVKVADFGIAKSIADSGTLTSTGLTIGTMSYLAPEAINGAPSTDRTDQYALACTAFQLLTGTLPFGGDSPAQILSGHLTRPVPTVAERAVGLSPQLDAVFARALAKDPAHRFASSTEFANALAAAASAAPSAAPAAVIAPPTAIQAGPTTVIAPPPAAAPSNRKWALIAGAAVIAVLLAVGGAVLFWPKAAESAAAAPSSSAAPVDPTVRAREVAEKYALGAAAMDYRDMAAWESRVTWHTSPELTKKMQEAAAQLKATVVPLQWVGTSSDAKSIVLPSADKNRTVVQVYVSVVTKTTQRPEGVATTVTYIVTMDNTRDFLITDVGGDPAK